MSEDRAIGALVGLAIGDAVGTTLEFETRDSGEPLTDMVGGGPFDLEPGQWTDDTAMAIALAESLVACGALDPVDLMSRFVDWWRKGSYSCTGRCFDIGLTTRAALVRFERDGDPFAGSVDAFSAGNGSLMRLAPVAIRFAAADERSLAADQQSRTSHAATACIDACVYFADLISDAIDGQSKREILEARAGINDPDVARVAAGSWRNRSRRSIRSTGYVIDSLEAALWCISNTEDFASAVLTASNLGDDADTVAAITGQLAGALYGASAIPTHWRRRLAWSRRIVGLAQALFASRVRVAQAISAA